MAEYRGSQLCRQWLRMTGKVEKDTPCSEYRKMQRPMAVNDVERKGQLHNVMEYFRERGRKKNVRAGGGEAEL